MQVARTLVLAVILLNALGCSAAMTAATHTSCTKAVEEAWQEADDLPSGLTGQDLLDELENGTDVARWGFAHDVAMCMQDDGYTCDVGERQIACSWPGESTSTVLYRQRE